MFTVLRLDLSSGRPAAIQRGLSPVPRWRATVDATLELTHERVNDVPLLLGFLIKLQLPEILDRHFPAHPLHQGLSNGWLITVWIAYILSRADHRKSPRPSLDPGTPPHPRDPHRPDHPPRRVQRRPLDLAPEAPRLPGRLGVLGSRPLAHPL